MIQENARVLIETRLQELLSESITCWEQYRNISKEEPILIPLYLDRFILILQNIKDALKDLQKEKQPANLEHSLHYERKNSLKKKE